MMRFLRSMSLLLAVSSAGIAEQPSLHELLATLSNRRTSAEEALRQTARTCPGESIKVREAQKRYRAAREKSNGFLDTLILDLGQDDLRREKVYRARLEDSQKAVDALLSYLDGADCQGRGQAKVAPVVLALAGKLPDFISWVGGWIGRRSDAARAHRETLAAQLKEMRWRPLEDVVKGVEAPAEGSRESGSAPAPVPAEAVPALRLETGLHTAAIRALSFSRDGRVALTASEDKTARLWDVGTGRLLSTIRPTEASGKVGMLYAAALSPDGRLAALGGWTRGNRDGGHAILLVDTQTGTFQRVVEVGPQVVNFLAFSPDGRRLAAHLGGNLGLRMLRVADGALLGQDLDYAQPSYRGAFDAQGRYAATSDDGDIRLYDAAFRLLKRVKASAPGPFGVAFHPDGSRLAVAYADHSRVEVLSTPDLGVACVPVPGAGKLGLVAWSTDGRTLLASGGEDFGASRTVLRHWSQEGRGPGEETPIARATVSELVPLASGEVAYGAQDPAWGVVDAQGRPRILQAIHQTDLRVAREAFRTDARALSVALPGRTAGTPDRAFSLRDLDLVTAAEGVAPRLGAPGLKVDGWKDTERPVLNGQPLALEPAETSRSLCVAPGGAGFLLGTDWYLRAYTAQGAERWKTYAPAPVWGLAQREDGRLAVAMLADGTFRWYRTSDGRELLSLYVASDQRWVLWTPSGRFCTSLGGESLVGWQVNRKDQAADFFPLAQFRERFWKPELMLPLLETLDEAAALGTLAGAAGVPQAQATALPGAEDWPPVLRILAPSEGEAMAGGTVNFQVSVRTHGPSSRIAGFRVFLDGARVPPSRGLRPQQTTATAAREDRTYLVPVSLPAHPVQVGIQAELEGGRLSDLVVRRVTVKAPPAAPAPPAVTAPMLRVLAIGVTQYANPKYNLQFPAKDAADISQVFQRQAGKLFDKVEVKLLVDAQATEKNILLAMDQLAASSRPGMVTLYFFSSHGGTNAEKSSYYLLPHDFAQGSWGLDGKAIRERLEATQGWTLMLMDTCHSGNVLGENRMRSLGEAMDRIRFINELLQAGPGTVVFSSSTGAQTSLESPAWANGAFTKALREGLAGGADPARTGRVTTDALETFIRRRVPEITGGRQTPVVAKTPTAVPFPVVIVDGPGRPAAP